MSDWDEGGERIPVQVTSPPEARPDRRRDEADLDVLVTDLERTLRELREEVEAGGDARPRRRGRRGTGALPRPPSPREVLRFTEAYTIPTAVAFLEAAIRGLELLAGAIRLLDGRDPRPEQRPGGEGSVLADVSVAAGERAAASGREALARVDDALAELQRTYEGEPEDPTARRLLADARTLRGEIDERLSALEQTGANGDGGPDASSERERGPEVDVDAELASLKEQAGRGDEPGADDGDGDEPGA